MKNNILSLGLVLLSSAAMAGESIEQTLDAAANGRVLIENLRGDIKVIGWDKNQVKVSGEIDDEAEGYEFKRHGKRVIFEVDMPRGNYHDRSKGSDLTFYIPKGSKLSGEGVLVNFQVSGIHGGSSVETVNGDISASSLSSEIQLETINGSITTENLQGQIEIHSINGGITDSNSKGQLEFQTVNGPIKSTTEAQFIELQSVNSNIELEAMAESLQELSIQVANASADINVNQLADNGEIRIDTVSGNISLSLDKNVSADFSLQNHAGGRIKNRLSNDKPERPKYGPGSYLDMSLNGGSASVAITSVSANIELLAH